MDRAEAMAEPEGPTPAISEYVEALLQRWPDIGGDAGKDNPWSDGPLVSNSNGNLFYFGMIFRMADEASEFAARLAQERGHWRSARFASSSPTKRSRSQAAGAGPGGGGRELRRRRYRAAQRL